MTIKEKARLFIARQPWPVITNAKIIAEAIGCDRSTIKKAIKALEKEGTLKRVKIDRFYSQYILVSKQASTLNFLAESAKQLNEDFADWKKTKGLENLPKAGDR